MTKKILFYIAAFLLTFPLCFAQSIGSEITYKSTAASGIYEVTLVIYRSCNDIALCSGTCGGPCTQMLTLMGADSGYTTSNFGNITLTLQNVRDIKSNIQQCASAKNTCTNRGCVTPGTFSVGYERYEFKGLANIGATSGIPANCCTVRFVFNTIVSRFGIQTITSSGSIVYQDAVINRCLSIGIYNSSPEFTIDPLYIACGGENINYNNGLLDPDRDSLSISFAPALVAYNTPISYTSPFSYDRPMPWTGNITCEAPGCGIRCDPLTGDVSFTPGNVSGQNFNGIIAFKCDQWRKIGGIYKLLGTVRRECPMTILANCSPNNTPRLITSPPNGANPNAPKNFFEIMAGQPLCFTITAKDTDFIPPIVSDTTFLSWNQSLVPYGATFTPAYSGTRSATGPREDMYQFCWTPHDSTVSSLPYSFVVNTSDNRCPDNGKKSQAFQVRVLGNPKPELTSKMLQCNTLKFLYRFNNPGTANVASVALQISRDTSDQSQPSIINYQGMRMDTLLQHIFSRSGKHYLTFMAIVQGASGYSYTHVLRDSVVVPPFNLNNSIVVTQPQCFGAANGKLNVFATNGTSPYKYKFNTDITYGLTNTFKDLAAGTYVITTKDASNCTRIDTIEINQPMPVRSQLSFTVNQCDTTGILTATATGGNGTYTYSLNGSPAQQNGTFAINTSGLYRLETTDSLNCKTLDSTQLYLPLKLRQQLSFSKNACDSTGRIHIKASGGKLPYRFRLNNSVMQDTPVFIVHQSGYYTIKLLDSNNCEQRDSLSVWIRDPFRYNAIKRPISCFNTADGILALSASGGNSRGTYTYRNRTTGETNTTGIFEQLDSGYYEFTIKDDSNCILIHNDYWKNPAILTIGSISGDSIVKLHQTYMYGVSSNKPLTYNWVAVNGTIVSGQGTAIVSVKWDSIGYGLLEVEGSDSSQCSVLTDKRILVSSVGIAEQMETNMITIFPNPTNDIVSISVKSLSDNNTLLLYDIQGKLLLKQELKTYQDLKLEELPEGIYILRVGGWYGKLMKQ